MIAITAASGHLGHLVIDALLEKTPANQLVAVVRSPAKAAALAARGVAVRTGDYNDASGLQQAFAGVEKVLLISSNEMGRRVAQHQNAITAARKAGVKLIVYTSLLRADRTTLDLGLEHRETEKILEASGVPFIILRNGWYMENHTASVGPALTNGAFLGSASQGRISSATRADYAAAAAVALTGGAKIGQTYELAGDTAFTLTELAAEISRQTGKSIPYHDLPKADYAAILLKAGLPPVFAHGLAQWDVDASHGALFDDGRQLSRLIGRPTTSLSDAVKQALNGPRP